MGAIKVTYLSKAEGEKLGCQPGVQIMLSWAHIAEQIGQDHYKEILADALAKDILIEQLARAVSGNKATNPEYDWMDVHFPTYLVERARVVIAPLAEPALREAVEKWKAEVDRSREIVRLARSYVLQAENGYSPEGRRAAWEELRKEVLSAQGIPS